MKENITEEEKLRKLARERVEFKRQSPSGLYSDYWLSGPDKPSCFEALSLVSLSCRRMGHWTHIPFSGCLWTLGWNNECGKRIPETEE